jgi:hypothetical protein
LVLEALKGDKNPTEHTRAYRIHPNSVGIWKRGSSSGGRRCSRRASSKATLRTGQLVVRDYVRLSYALCGCRDNPEMETFRNRLKSENRSLFLDALTFAGLERLVGQRITYYQWSATALIPRDSSSTGVFGELLLPER